MFHVCVITPIAMHPRFKRARPVQFTHVSGSIFQNKDGQEMYLSRDVALTLARWLQVSGEEYAIRNEPMKAAQSYRDAKDLKMAVAERDAFWSTVNVWPVGAA